MRIRRPHRLPSQPQRGHTGPEAVRYTGRQVPQKQCTAVPRPFATAVYPQWAQCRCQPRSSTTGRAADH